jgi:hypothetical protein
LKTALSTILFVLVSLALAEGPTNSLKIQLQWDQQPTVMSNILYYVTHHAGPDGVLTNYGRIYPFSIYASGLAYPATCSAWLTQGLVQGTNLIGLSAVMVGGLYTPTNVFTSVISFDLPQK